ncbi:GMC family oxidoreductase N-terminal domain-containing protein, partial [Pseudomonas aeruginosa]
LCVKTHALSAKIIMQGKRACGIAYYQGSEAKEVRARREVILSAGTFGSPQLLLLSGIGPAKDLQAVGIPVVHDLPGVGENGSVAKIVKLEHAWRRLDGRNDDGFQ